MTGSVSRYCTCAGPDGKRLGKACPRLTSTRHGAWMFVVDVPASDGKRRQVRRGGFRSKAAAEAARDALLGKVRTGVSVDDRTTTGDWFAYWLAEKTKPAGASAAGKKVRATTGRSYRHHVEHNLTPRIGALPLTKQHAEHIAAAYDDMMAKPDRPGATGKMGAATLRRVHTTLRSALNAAVRARRIDRNPALYVELPDARRPKVEPWSPAELGAFLDSVQPHRLGVVYEVMALTGCGVVRRWACAGGMSILRPVCSSCASSCCLSAHGSSSVRRRRPVARTVSSSWTTRRSGR